MMFRYLSLASVFIFSVHVCCGQKEYEVKNDEAIIVYKVYGAGKPLLLINGGPGYSSGRLHQVASELSNQFQVILFDQRGTGKSKVKKCDSLTINLKTYVSDMEAVRKDLKLNSWMVGGHSFGGLLAMTYASFFPDRVDKLLLISSAGLNLNFITSFQDNIKYIIGKDTINYQVDEGANAEDFYYNMVSVNAPAYVYDKMKVDVMRKQLTDRSSFTFEVSSLMWNDLFYCNFDLSAKLKTFKKKTLIIQGAQDVVGMDTAYETHSIISTSALEFIRKCGHVPWLDQPSAFYTKTRSFLAN